MNLKKIEHIRLFTTINKLKLNQVNFVFGKAWTVFYWTPTLVLALTIFTLEPVSDNTRTFSLWPFSRWTLESHILSTQAKRAHCTSHIGPERPISKVVWAYQKICHRLKLGSKKKTVIFALYIVFSIGYVC